jgi:hypothetical protein
MVHDDSGRPEISTDRSHWRFASSGDRLATCYFFSVLTMIGPVLAAPPDETAVTKNS